jgi:hypothetical protein
MRHLLTKSQFEEWLNTPADYPGESVPRKGSISPEDDLEEAYGLWAISDAEMRNCPDDNNTYKFIAQYGGEVHISDIFGGHEALIPFSEWKSWPLVEKDNDSDI